MISDPRQYAKVSLLGFIVGSVVFFFISPMLILSYYHQFWLLLGCMGACMALACGAARYMNRSAQRPIRKDYLRRGA